MTEPCSIVVIGSVNLDFVATVDRLPVAGETVTGADLKRFPGGKGANQALAARRLGACVSLVARVGCDPNADEALALLVAGGVNLDQCSRDDNAPTGVALIAVCPTGDNQIVVAPGANRMVTVANVRLPKADALICQLETPTAVLEHVLSQFAGHVSVNLAPATDVPDALIRRADLVVVNETESEFYGAKLDVCGGLVATTLGAAGAVLTRAGVELARSRPPAVRAVDTTGCGDTFTAALTLAVIEGMELQDALDFACTAGAAAATRPGAQPSLPFRAEIDALIGNASVTVPQRG